MQTTHELSFKCAGALLSSLIGIPPIYESRSKMWKPSSLQACVAWEQSNQGCIIRHKFWNGTFSCYKSKFWAKVCPKISATNQRKIVHYKSAVLCCSERACKNSGNYVPLSSSSLQKAMLKQTHIIIIEYSQGQHIIYSSKFYTCCASSKISFAGAFARLTAVFTCIKQKWHMKEKKMREYNSLFLSKVGNLSESHPNSRSLYVKGSCSWEVSCF